MLRRDRAVEIVDGHPCPIAGGYRERGWAVLIITLACTLALVWLAFAEPAHGVESSGSAEQRREAVDSIPFDQLHAQAAARIRAVVDQPSIYRRMPEEVVQCDTDLYVFMVRYPEIVVNMWQLMGVTKVNVRRTGAFTFQASDGAGTTSTVELIYGSRNLHVMYAEGEYAGPLFGRKITGRCVLVLSSNFQADDKKQTLIGNRLDVFMQLDNAGVDFLARTLHPLFGKTADNNFMQSAKFLGQVSEVAIKNAPGMQRLAGKLDNVDPAIRDKFASLAAAVAARATEPETPAATTALRDEDVLRNLTAPVPR